MQSCNFDQDKAAGSAFRVMVRVKDSSVGVGARVVLNVSGRIRTGAAIRICILCRFKVRDRFRSKEMARGQRSWGRYSGAQVRGQGKSGPPVCIIAFMPPALYFG